METLRQATSKGYSIYHERLLETTTKAAKKAPKVDSMKTKAAI